MCTERKATGEYVLACFMFASMDVDVEGWMVGSVLNKNGSVTQ